jgi:hypothetical protein
MASTMQPTPSPNRIFSDKSSHSTKLIRRMTAQRNIETKVISSGVTQNSDPLGSILLVYATSCSKIS